MEKIRQCVSCLVVLPVRLYQMLLRPYIPPCCRFYPSCSSYTIQAINQFGILKGGKLGLFRVLRCHPWCQGGYDPIPDKRDFK